ncbi:hypothetical protein ACA910_022200 [Epithemia clementina (nom. ined.)]
MDASGPDHVMPSLTWTSHMNTGMTASSDFVALTGGIPNSSITPTSSFFAAWVESPLPTACLLFDVGIGPSDGVASATCFPAEGCSFTIVHSGLRSVMT